MNSSTHEVSEHRVRVDGADMRLLRAGDPEAPPVVFLHGWPECALGWTAVMRLAAAGVHAVALDLPGVGRSAGLRTDGSKAALARRVRDVVDTLGLRGVTLVGHDIGGMVTYSYLRRYPDLRAAVIMDVVIPGLEPWPSVVRNPHIWHFALHAVPELPERLVSGRERAYFDHFYDALTVERTAITDEQRAAYTAAYTSPDALAAGFDWYRAFPRDAEANAVPTGPVDTPVLYLRGEAALRRATTTMNDYLKGLRGSGLRRVTPGLVTGARHFLAEEAPAETWRLISEFLGAAVAG